MAANAEALPKKGRSKHEADTKQGAAKTPGKTGDFKNKQWVLLWMFLGGRRPTTPVFCQPKPAESY
jgi:hypothetical protein